MVHAVQHVRKMRGGAQSHLMRCSDDEFYVVKFQNNPQHLRVLANELLASRLAEKLGLAIPFSEVVEVSSWLVAATQEMDIEIGGKASLCMPGLQFGSQYVADPAHGIWHAFDHLPDHMLERVRNLQEFAGILCLDKWTCNANGRQAVFVRTPRQRVFRAMFVDQGYCFNAGEWNFPDSPLRGVYSRNAVYAGVTGWKSFEPWLSRIETFAESEIGEIASIVPPEWYGGWDDMEQLVEQLVERRNRVRNFIAAFRNSSRNPFPQWTESKVVVM